MDFVSYLKKELDNILFLEIAKDIKVKDRVILQRGEYPVYSRDMVSLAKGEKENIPISFFINGMAYVLSCDLSFKYRDFYIDCLKNIKEAKSYLIMQIENNKNTNLKEALIYARALCTIYNQKEYIMNQIYLLMSLNEKTGYKFLEEEIVYELKNLSKDYPDYSAPHFFLGEYYLDKDRALSKMYLSKCLNDEKFKRKAEEYINKIDITEEYDKAVEKIKVGEGSRVIDVLNRYLEFYPNDMNCKYYLAMALRQRGDYENALFTLYELLENGELPEIYNEIGLNYACINQFDRALESFKSSLKIKPDNSDIICNMGVCHYYLNNLEEAQKAFNLALRLNPKDDVAKLWIEKCR
ncbi:Tetratricopeptide repeat-containing protein [Caloramator quimbayensis]|uniref:Tetratricopeptide repeat-containing protein n=1 Tax=Caloramator quimbayensis TaxID=1147123 RepID=A0A1T4XYA1_9CLOT|nr:tetratricopeptide repeat protein [Caloramator quimbayensis]SKA93991.1 Tetratricopeptide repeat-containing protein [Caloramator quimbayensis]